MFTLIIIAQDPIIETRHENKTTTVYTINWRVIKSIGNQKNIIRSLFKLGFRDHGYNKNPGYSEKIPMVPEFHRN